MKMYTYSPRRKKKPRWIWIMAVLLVAGALLIWLWPDGEKDAPQAGSEATADYSEEAAIAAGDFSHAPADKKHQNNNQVKDSVNGRNPIAKQPAPPAPSHAGSKVVFGPKGMTAALAEAIGPSPITTPKLSKDQAQQAMTEAMKLIAADKDLIKARSLLNSAYVSGTLPDPQAESARKALESLADRTVLAADSYVNAQDPYLINYTFRAGDMLNSTRKDGVITHKGIIARFDLNVPADILLKVNRLPSSSSFIAGRSYKLIKGPFHLVVYKDKRVADVYLQDLFVRRIPICIGAPETPTPEGYFRLTPFGKTMNSAYNSPAETGQPNYTLLPHDPGYPLDKLGHNMKIEGISELGTTITASQSYAIHGTNNQASVGTAASRGCIRVDDENIKFLYGILQSYADPKNPSITWKRWSTVTIRK